MRHYKYTCTPEAANDLSNPEIGFDNPNRKFHHATLETYNNIDGKNPQQHLHLYYELVGYEFGKDYNMMPMISMPLTSVIDMVKFATGVMADAYHLTHEDRLP